MSPGTLRRPLIVGVRRTAAAALPDPDWVATFESDGASAIDGNNVATFTTGKFGFGQIYVLDYNAIDAAAVVPGRTAKYRTPGTNGAPVVRKRDSTLQSMVGEIEIFGGDQTDSATNDARIELGLTTSTRTTLLPKYGETILSGGAWMWSGTDWVFENNAGQTIVSMQHPKGQASAPYLTWSNADVNQLFLRRNYAPTVNLWQAPLPMDAGKAVTGTAATDIVTCTAHGYTAGEDVRFCELTGGAGLVAGQAYYVIAANLAANTFQVSTTPGGAAVNFTSDLTAGRVAAFADELKGHLIRWMVRDYIHDTDGTVELWWAMDSDPLVKQDLLNTDANADAKVWQGTTSEADGGTSAESSTSRRLRIGHYADSPYAVRTRKHKLWVTGIEMLKSTNPDHIWAVEPPTLV